VRQLESVDADIDGFSLYIEFLVEDPPISS
jgi:hypothetical protein